MLKKKKTAPMSLIGAIIEKLPLAIIAGLAAFTSVVVILLLLGQFRTDLIWSIGPIAGLICGWGVFRLSVAERPGKRRENIICDLLVLIGVVAWGGYNMMLTSQHVLTSRDPATYAVASSWLSQHESFKQPDTGTFSGVQGVHANSAGFAADTKEGMMYPQGQHALPALLGSIGKFVGPDMVLHFNVLFGMTSLLAVYCFARIFMKARWAMLGAAVMALTLPLIYFSRDTYTEPLALTFTFGGLALIALAQKRRSLWLWGIAGLVFSSSLLARIDAYLALVGVAAFLVVYVALAKADRKKRLAEAGMFAVPTVGVGILAWLDLKLLSPSYYESTESLVTLELAALVAVIATGLVGIGVTILFPKVLPWLHAATKRWRAGLAATVILVAGIVMATLPLWYEPMGQQVNGVVAEIQQEMGVEVEARKYTEFAGYWVSWYIGPIIAALGVAGLAYAAFRSMHDKSLLWLCALFVIIGTAVVYFIQPSITPDQIWASRRMLPVIMPGVVVFGVYALSLLADKLQFSSRYFKGALLMTGSVALLIAPLTVSAPFITKRLIAQQQLVDDVCDNLPDNAAVVWIGLARLEMIQPTRTYCGVEAYGYQYQKSDTPTRQALAAIAKRAKQQGKVPYVGVYRHQYGGLIDEANQRGMTEVSSTVYRVTERTLVMPPTKINDVVIGASLGIIGTDGTITKIE